MVDNNHEAGQTDASIRPNQIMAVGGLPHAVIDGEQAKKVLATVEDKLLTPLGLRSWVRTIRNTNPFTQAAFGSETGRIIKAPFGPG